MTRELGCDKEGVLINHDSPLNIKWKRVVIDEAHRIKNHTTGVSKAVCAIRAKYR